jgi:hypothetical protein
VTLLIVIALYKSGPSLRQFAETVAGCLLPPSKLSASDNDWKESGNHPAVKLITRPTGRHVDLPTRPSCLPDKNFIINGYWQLVLIRGHSGAEYVTFCTYRTRPRFVPKWNAGNYVSALLHTSLRRFLN